MTITTFIESKGYLTEKFSTNFSYGFLFYSPAGDLVGEVHESTGTYALYLPVSKDVTKALEEHRKAVKEA